MIDNNIHRQIINIPYYEDNTRISNSNIGWFLNKGPAYLYAMLNGKIRVDTGAQLDKGTRIHEYLLQPEEFQKDYVVWDKCRPASEQQKQFCQALAHSIEIEPEKAVLSAYKQAYRVGNKKDKTIVSEGLKMASELKEYIQFLKEDDKRILITPTQANQLMIIAEKIQEHKKAKQLLKNSYIGTEDELYHEFHINWEYNISDNEIIKCKSLLDSVHFDFRNKIVTLMDLKTTVHLHKFEDSINQYDYLRQMMYYTKAIKWYLENIRTENPQDWKYECYIIAINTTGLNEIRVFNIDYDKILERNNIIEKALTDIHWHQINNKWDHTRVYYEGDGTEKLSL